ncbi:MAG TPA: DUF4398 domain-containing protein [Haliangiales bacterium]|nr:DUF4398 domain-containing protein [Haliangiales bacterium]
MRAFALAVGLAWGCGPVNYISEVSLKASSAVEAARGAGADKLAPYEYTSAVEYLHKAKEEAGFADFQASVRFGQKAIEMAEKAKKIALDSSHGTGDAETPPRAEAKP